MDKVGKFRQQPGLNTHVYILNTSEGAIEVTTDRCTCYTFTSMKIPCRHIFALRKELGEALYSPKLCDKRWTKKHYSNCHRIFNHNNDEMEVDDYDILCGDSITIEKEQHRARVLSQQEKYKKAFVVAQKIASITSEACGKLFRDWLESLQQI